MKSSAISFMNESCYLQLSLQLFVVNAGFQYYCPTDHGAARENMEKSRQHIASHPVRCVHGAVHCCVCKQLHPRRHRRLRQVHITARAKVDQSSGSSSVTTGYAFPRFKWRKTHRSSPSLLPTPTCIPHTVCFAGATHSYHNFPTFADVPTYQSCTGLYLSNCIHKSSFFEMSVSSVLHDYLNITDSFSLGFCQLSSNHVSQSSACIYRLKLLRKARRVITS